VLSEYSQLLEEVVGLTQTMYFKYYCILLQNGVFLKQCIVFTWWEIRLLPEHPVGE